jgi:alkylhydroperoxidase/carboxymuconolactone decarboxylase family protein YurZ
MTQTREYPYGKLVLDDAHYIAGAANAFLTALQEYTESGTEQTDKKLALKGVKLGDSLLTSAQVLTSRGIFSKERYLSETLIYSSAVVIGCEICALTHIDGALRARVPQSIVETVNAIALYVRSQAEDDTYLLFDSYKSHWQRFEEWPRLSHDKMENCKFYNLVALLMSMVVRKRRLLRYHTEELLLKTDVIPEEILEVAGIAQVMGGFPARWEIIHVYDVVREIVLTGKLGQAWQDLLNLISEPLHK